MKLKLTLFCTAIGGGFLGTIGLIFSGIEYAEYNKHFNQLNCKNLTSDTTCCKHTEYSMDYDKDFGYRNVSYVNYKNVINQSCPQDDWHWQDTNCKEKCNSFKKNMNIATALLGASGFVEVAAVASYIAL